MFEQDKDIYKLELHELTQIRTKDGATIFVLRVPSGWIYTFGEHSTFVPFFEDN